MGGEKMSEWKKWDFNMVDCVVGHLDKFPDEWQQRENILEFWDSEQYFCKIHTGDGLWFYIIASDNYIYNPSFIEKIKIYRAIGRYRKYIIKQLLLCKDKRKG
jgi:hypothetical protein